MGTSFGCGVSEEDWQLQLDTAEGEMFAAVPGLDMDRLLSTYYLMFVDNIMY